MNAHNLQTNQDHRKHSFNTPFNNQSPYIFGLGSSNTTYARNTSLVLRQKACRNLTFRIDLNSTGNGLTWVAVRKAT